jgi:hypothetical protein
MLDHLTRWPPRAILAGASALAMVVVVACATPPPSRLSQYLGPSADVTVPEGRLPEQRPLRAALVVVSDTSARDAAPSLPDEALDRVAANLKDQFNSFLPIMIEAILPADSLTPGDPGRLRELGTRHRVDYLLIAVLSSTEREYPMYVFLGWTSHMQPGLRRDNWSLAEVALIDLSSGRTLLKAEGRGWATLDRPTAPGINQWYPVVWLRPQEPNRRYWPPTYAGAPITLRVIAMNEAIKRLVINLQDAWIRQRQLELDQGAASARG